MFSGILCLASMSTIEGNAYITGGPSFRSPASPALGMTIPWRISTQSGVQSYALGDEVGNPGRVPLDKDFDPILSSRSAPLEHHPR